MTNELGDRDARPSDNARWRFWIDRGGTFTDVIGAAPGGALHTTKVPSRSPAYEEAAVEGMRFLLHAPPPEGGTRPFRWAPEIDRTRFPAEQVEVIRMGTTVATNALLERQGARTLLVTTAGFPDLLEIGDQARPELFALRIVKPEPLHADVVEAAERLSADGAVLSPLDEPALAAALAQARADGFESVAVALLHADLNPAHEQAAGRLARAAGFAHVSLSHEVSPLPRLVPRARTAVVDAYLTPVLRAYVERLSAAVEGAPLWFMTSAGALVSAEAFRGRDAVLSGPAGGVVGVGEVARAAGEAAVLGFDMGGTSTDVSRWAGRLDRRETSVAAGFTVRAPALDVETVAAGGGSILRFDGLRARVGPESAGADPGPAAYGRGGPATVTDANLVLGRLAPERFPALFGPAGDQPLDAAAARAALTALADAMGAASPEAAAAGFLAVAVEQTAQAVRRISSSAASTPAPRPGRLRRRRRARSPAIVAYALGCAEVLCPEQASVLSAWGIGQAEVAVLRQAGLDAPLDDPGLARAETLAADLAAEAETPSAPKAETPGGAASRSASATTAATPPSQSPPPRSPPSRRVRDRTPQALRFTDPTRTLLIASVEVDRQAASQRGAAEQPPDPRASFDQLAERIRSVLDEPPMAWRGPRRC
jgi:5-oxoprolinase (ATP-hydrolysing)